MATATPTLMRQIAPAGLLCFAAGSLYAWSALIPALRARYAVGVAEAGQVFSLAIVAFSVAVMVAPRLPQRARGLTGAAAAGVLAALATALAVLAPDYRLFLVCFSLGFGTMSGAIYIFTLEIAAASRSPGMATPLMVAAFGLGGVVFGPLMRRLVAAGWGTGALFSVALTLLLAAAVVLAMRRAPVVGLTSAEVADAEFPGSVRILVLLWLTFGFGSGAGLMTLGLASTLIEDRGASVGLSSLVLAGVAIGNTGGRLSVGLLARHLKPALIVVLSPLLGIGGLMLLTLLPNTLVSAAALTIVATSYGLLASAMPVLTRSVSGAQGFRKAFSIVFTSWGVAGLVAPWLAGKIHDVTGSFSLAIVLAMLACLASFSASLFVLAKTRASGASR